MALTLCGVCGKPYHYPLTPCERHQDEAIRLLRTLVETARPAFPRTPYREALDEAKRFLEAQ